MRVSAVGALLALGTLSLSSCRTQPPAPVVQQPQATTAWREDLLGAPVAPSAAWWTEFQDDALNALVEQALANSPSIGAARARVLVAQQERRAIAGQQEVQANLYADAALQRGSENRPGGAFSGGTNQLYGAGVELTWEADLWGRLESQVQVADEALAVSVELRRVAADALIAELARERAELRGAQGELLVLERSLSLLRESLELERSRLAGGFSTELDVARLEAEVAASLALVPNLQGRVEAARHRLAGLAACDVAQVERWTAAAQERGVVPVDLALGTPLDALDNRSDVRLAQRELLRQTALLGLAEAETKPRLSIGAALGTQTDDLGSLVDASSRTLNLGGSFLAPLFNGQRLEAARDAQLARAEAAAEDWRATVLRAWSETEAAIVELRRERQRLEALQAQRTIQERALVLARDRQQNGLVDYFEVLAAQRALLTVDQELARTETALLQRTVSLLRAIGGQWRASPDEASQSS